jgi:hypothetical protein
MALVVIARVHSGYSFGERATEGELTGPQRNLFVAGRREQLMRFDPIPRRTTSSALGGMLAGFAVLLGAEVPTSIILAANLRLYPPVPWGPVIAAVFLYFAWQYLNGRGWPPESSAARQRMLRARTLPTAVWLWSLISGGLGLVTWGALALLI